MKIRKFALSLAMASVCATLFSASTLAADYTLKVSAPVAPTEKDIIYAWMKAFESNVEKASGGRIDVQLYPANQLGQMPAALQGASLGSIEVSLAIIGYIGSLDPRFGVLDAGGLFDNEGHILRTLQDPEVQGLLSDFGATANVETLAVLPSGQGVIVGNRAIGSTADFKGLKVRTGGATPLLNNPLQALGASPVNLPLGEVLPAMQTRAIDSAVLNMSVLNSFQYQDVATEATYMPGSFTIVGAVVSKDFLQRVGPELAAIVREQALAAQSVYDDYLEHSAQEREAIWTGNGGAIRHLDEQQIEAYQAVTRPVVENIVAQNARIKGAYELLKAAAARNL